MRKTLLIGGAGFVGNNLARTLLGLGHEVVVFDDFSTGRRENLADMEGRIEVVEGDVRDEAATRRVVTETEPDIVYHLAALHFIPDCNKDPEKARAINVDGPMHVPAAAAKWKKKPRFVLVSASSVYKPSDKKIKETDPVEPFEVYGKTKLEGEKIVHERCAKYGMEYFIVRPFSIYGPFNAVPQVIPEIISQLKKGNDKIVLGNMEPHRDFIYVTDVAEALALFSERGVSGEAYNFGDHTSHSIREVAELIKELLEGSGRAVEFESDPALFRGDLERASLVGDDRKVQEHLGWKSKIELRRGIEMILKAEGLI